jgi:hypothetical protein
MTKTTTRTATDAGHCQVCGALQLLPAGRLSKHGYTVEYGFFSGTCYGSGELPFELSCDLVRDSIKRAQDYVAGLRTQIAELQQPTDSSTAWAHLFVRSSRNGSIYQWTRVELSIVTHEPRDSKCLDGRIERYTPAPDITFTSPIADRFGKTTRAVGRDYPVSGYPKTIAEAVVAMNAQRIAFLQREIDKLNSYVKQQKQRVAEWKLTELLPRAKYPKSR